jgi:N-methylhydantoinase B
VGGPPRLPSSQPAASVDDTITAEVIRNALLVAVEESSIVVVRSSHSTWIQEGADAASALLDREGRLIAQSTSTSLMHAASLRCSLPAVLADQPADAMRPGDIYALNDPYRGGIHANDILVFRPIFVADRVAYFAGTVIHVADVGGSSAGGLAALATDTFAEGLLLPPIALHREGVPQRDVWRILERNSRVPDKVVGDVQALIAGVTVVSRRVDELVERYGGPELARFVEGYLDYAERRMREDLSTLPSGVHVGRYSIDTDGVDPARTFVVEVALTITGGAVDVNFSGTSRQSAGAINASFSQSLSGIIYAIRCFVDPGIPMNEGCFRPVTVHLPEGSLVNPLPPAACGGRVVTVAAAVEAILAALSEARPSHAVAPSGLIHVYTLSGTDAAGRPWVSLLYEFGGIGARSGSDGPDATGCFFLGGRSVIPQLEPLEAQYPFRAVHSRLVADSGGPGRWRGGLGVELCLEVTAPATLTVRGDRMVDPPPGALGGRAGRGGWFEVERVGGDTERLATKQQGVMLRPGDRFVLRTSGGGGLGDPFERDPDLVAADVVDGRVTLAGALRDYGVVLDGALGVNIAATNGERTGTPDDEHARAAGSGKA